MAVAKWLAKGISKLKGAPKVVPEAAPKKEEMTKYLTTDPVQKKKQELGSKLLPKAKKAVEPKPITSKIILKSGSLGELKDRLAKAKRDLNSVSSTESKEVVKNLQTRVTGLETRIAKHKAPKTTRTKEGLKTATTIRSLEKDIKAYKNALSTKNYTINGIKQSKSFFEERLAVKEHQLKGIKKKAEALPSRVEERESAKRSKRGADNYNIEKAKKLLDAGSSTIKKLEKVTGKTSTVKPDDTPALLKKQQGIGPKTAIDPKVTGNMFLKKQAE